MRPNLGGLRQVVQHKEYSWLKTGQSRRVQKFYRGKRLLNIEASWKSASYYEILRLQDPTIRPLSDATNDSRTTAESRSRKCSRRDVRRAADVKHISRLGVCFALLCGVTMAPRRLVWKAWKRKQIFATGRISSPADQDHKPTHLSSTESAY